MLQQRTQHRAVYKSGFVIHMLWLLLSWWLLASERRDERRAEKTLFTRLSTLFVRRTVLMARLVLNPSFASIKEETLIDDPLRCKGHYYIFRPLTQHFLLDRPASTLVSSSSLSRYLSQNSKLARDLEYPCRPLDPAEYLRRSCVNTHWPNKILLSVTIELLRHWFATFPEEFETEDLEIQLICTLLQDRRFKPQDCTENAVRFHFENFNFPALTHIISKLSKYEPKALQDPSTYEPEHPIYDAFEISIQAIMSRELLEKEISDQPFNMSGLITTLRRILGLARIQHFTALYGRSPNLRKKLKEKFIPWPGYEEARKFDNYVFAAVCDSAQQDVYGKYGATTPEEITYCQKIFNEVGYHGIWEGAPAPFPWTKEREPTLAMSRPRARSV